MNKAAREKSLSFSESLKIFEKITSDFQFLYISTLTPSEEKDFYNKKIEEYAHRFQAMPETYGQDGLGKKAIVHLHYFFQNSHFYLTEKDMEEEQYQAFGLAILNSDIEFAEIGYISLVEVIECGAELDLHWEPITIEEVEKKWGIK